MRCFFCRSYKIMTILTGFQPNYIFLCIFFYENLYGSYKNRNFANELYPNKSNQYKRDYEIFTKQ